VVFVFVFGFRFRFKSALFANINFFSSAGCVAGCVVRTAVVFFAVLAVDSDFFFYEMFLSLRRRRKSEIVVVGVGVGMGVRRLAIVF
jgi:hypothetical protein